jgi:hypothetical protein
MPEAEKRLHISLIIKGQDKIGGIRGHLRCQDLENQASDVSIVTLTFRHLAQ